MAYPYFTPYYPQPMPMQSYSAPPVEQVETYIGTNGDSEFLKAIDGRKAEKVWKLVDELVEAVKILHPRMYTTFIDKVQDLQPINEAGVEIPLLFCAH